MLPRFDLQQPKGLREALELLAKPGDPVSPLAGGTNLIPDLRNGREAKRRFMSIARLDELRYVRSVKRTIEIGGGATVNDLLRADDIAKHAPALHASAKAFAGHMVRSAATVAGNICYGSPSADLLPPLLILDAEATIESAGKSRKLPVGQLNVGYKKTALATGELLTGIVWAKPAKGTRQHFYKIGMRKGDAISVANAAVSLKLDGQTSSHVRIALGSVAATVIRASEAEAFLEGREIDEAAIEKAADLAAAAAKPIDDLRASKDYRLHVTHVLVKRLLRQALEG